MKKMIPDLLIGSACLVLYPIAVAGAVNAWMQWDWISKAIWTAGSLYMPIGAAASFIRVGRFVER